MIWNVSQQLTPFGELPSSCRRVYQVYSSCRGWSHIKHGENVDSTLISIWKMLISSHSYLSGIWAEEVRGGHATSLILRVTWVPGDRCSPPSSLMPTREKGSPELWCSWQNHCPIPETNRTCLIQLILSYMVTTSFAPSACVSQVAQMKYPLTKVFQNGPTCHTLPIFSSLCFSLYIIQKHLAETIFYIFFLSLVFLFWIVSSNRERNFVYFVYFFVPNTLTDAL